MLVFVSSGCLFLLREDVRIYLFSIAVYFCLQMDVCFCFHNGCPFSFIWMPVSMDVRFRFSTDCLFMFSSKICLHLFSVVVEASDSVTRNSSTVRTVIGKPPGKTPSMLSYWGGHYGSNVTQYLQSCQKRHTTLLLVLN